MHRLIYLASQSPRRQQLLTQIGVSFELLLPSPEEDAELLEAILPGEAPVCYVQRVTELKLDAALTRLARLGLEAAPVLCADTTVALGRDILGKPVDAADATQMLQKLSGRAHTVLTAVAIGTSGQRYRALSRSRVTFAPISSMEIAAYVDTGEPMGKAGAYAVQGRAAAHIARTCGSFSGIMGLPLFETSNLLREMGCLP